MKSETFLKIIEDKWSYLVIPECVVIAAYCSTEAGSCHESTVLEG
jgi:hypothetical protein